MDFALYARVIWRFRLLVLTGLTLGLALAVLSTVRVGLDGVRYREDELWSSTTRVLVTQTGFPEGRLYGDGAVPTERTPIVDPVRFNNLAILYSQFATSDAVRKLVRQDTPLRGRILAAPVVAGEYNRELPMIDLTAISTSPRRAAALAERTATALRTYIREQQRVGNVPVADRAVIVPVVRPSTAELFRARSKTMAIVIFLAVAFITVALAFLLENLRPRAGKLGAASEQELEASRPPQRRSA
jgi:hypothetical protein